MIFKRFFLLKNKRLWKESEQNLNFTVRQLTFYENWINLSDEFLTGLHEFTYVLYGGYISNENKKIRKGKAGM